MSICHTERGRNGHNSDRGGVNGLRVARARKQRGGMLDKHGKDLN